MQYRSLETSYFTRLGVDSDIDLASTSSEGTMALCELNTIVQRRMDGSNNPTGKSQCGPSNAYGNH